MGVAACSKADEVRDPVDEDRGLTAARTGKKQQRAFCGHGSFLLHGI